MKGSEVIKGVIAAFTIFAFLLYPNLAYANTAPIRHPSETGFDGSVNFWNLFGMTQVIPGSEVSFREEVICTEQDVSGGSCNSGNYLLVFQLPSGKNNLGVTFQNLVGFTFNDQTNGSATVGVVQCDTDDTPPNVNTLALCTTLAPSGPASVFPSITFTHNASDTEVSFHISTIPAYPAGIATTQGQGLTLFILISQPTPLPIAIPKIS